MSIIEMFPKNAKCSSCNLNLNDVANGLVRCEPCLDLAESKIANRSIGGHFKEALLGIFNFQIVHFLASLKWMQEKICKTGDYEPGVGRFYTKGYIK